MQASIITAIICVTLIVISLIPHRSGKEKEYEYHVVHFCVPKGDINAIEKGIRTALVAYPGEVVAVCNDPYYPDMKVPTYSVIIKTPCRRR